MPERRHRRPWVDYLDLVPLAYSVIARLHSVPNGLTTIFFVAFVAILSTWARCGYRSQIHPEIV